MFAKRCAARYTMSAHIMFQLLDGVLSHVCILHRFLRGDGLNLTLSSCLACDQLVKLSDWMDRVQKTSVFLASETPEILA
jgi:hypothetical protein